MTHRELTFRQRFAAVMAMVVILSLMFLNAARRALATTAEPSSDGSLEFYQLDSSKIVAYRGDRAITHQELGELVKSLNRSAAEVNREP